ncbi:MAG: NAD(P)/FAD-dependent oxidoreductase [Cyanobacteria bacterium M_surface_10_m1_298]|nr:NAD(P)/FAD-dependent oxidoreductase [Cyanobacteria bacterium M_surface_10_m1_298]
MSEPPVWDVLIAGAGPAGSELAWRLAQQGQRVLLLDPLQDLQRQAFSSAALPLAAVEQFGIPDHVVAARWDRWQLIGPDETSRLWQGQSCLGAVLDFGALRCWMARRASAAGAQLDLGWRAEGSEPDGADGLQTQLRGAGGEVRSVRSRFVVDATGQRRALIGEDQASLVCGAGVEWLLRVDPLAWQRWSSRLSFVLGSRWVPQGYGWVFPMRPGELKLGVCRLEDPGRRQPPLHRLIQTLMQRLEIQPQEVLDRHGGLIRSSIDRREPHQRGRLLALGDAVSTANLLGGEGIRYALASAAVLAPLLNSALEGDQSALDRYPAQLRRQLGWRWSLSGRLARRTWLGLRSRRADARLQRLLTGLEASASAEALSQLLFDYRFERYGLRALPYLLGWR